MKKLKSISYLFIVFIFFMNSFTASAATGESVADITFFEVVTPEGKYSDNIKSPNGASISSIQPSGDLKWEYLGKPMQGSSFCTGKMTGSQKWVIRGTSYNGSILRMQFNEYDARNTDELKIIISDCKKLKKLMETFYTCYEKQWMKENKAVGFGVQDIRIGGMIARVAHCTKRLEKFVNGEIANIDELDNVQLDYFGNGTNYEKKDATVNSFKKIFTANILSW